MKSKYIIVLVTGVIFSLSATAQFRHEFAVSLGGGLSTLNYKPDQGDKKFFDTGSLGASGELSYTYFFTRKLGLRTGAEFALYNAKMTMDVFSDPPRYAALMTIYDYEEKQSLMFVNIPLMLQYQTKGLHRFYVSAGGKIGIPTNSEYHTDGLMNTSGSEYSLQNREKTTSLKLNPAYMASAEIGMKWRLTNRLVLYSGIYVDYAFNNVVKKADVPFLDYATGPDLQINSILCSEYAIQNNPVVGKRFTDKVSPMAVGIKLRLAFGAVHETRGKEEIFTSVDFEQNLIEQFEKQREEQEKWEAQLLFDKEKQKVFTPISNFPVTVSELTTEQKEDLDRKVEFLKLYPHLKVVCVGHTCNVGNNVVNENVGMKRAVTARRYLMDQGISRSRINTVSKGKEEPLVPNDTEENRLINRRVEFIVIEFY